MTDFDEPPYVRFRGQKHSGLGIASFVVALGAGFFELALCVVAGVLESSTPGGINENSPVAIAIGLGIIVALVSNLFGIGLGIGALLQKRRKKLFAILGITLGCATLLALCGLAIIGIAAQR